MSTITRADAATTSPLAVEGYSTDYEGRSVTHDLIGGGIAVTAVPQRLRSGTLELLYEDAADAWAAVALHLSTLTFTLTDPDVPQAGMTYLPGTVSPALEDETRFLWTVSVQYQEVEP